MVTPKHCLMANIDVSGDGNNDDKNKEVLNGSSSVTEDMSVF